MSQANQDFLVAVLIVRDEEDVIKDCISSLLPVVDAVYVYDTGSQDTTRAIAKELGAHVTMGQWNDDFARARNAALREVQAEWVLSIDADEIVVVDNHVLRSFLTTTSADALRITTQIEQDASSYKVELTRLFRPSQVHWMGRVHEQVVANSGLLQIESASSQMIALLHSGYKSDLQRKIRARRNAELAKQAIADPALDKTERARAGVDLGRSYISLGEKQAAADVFERVRDEFPGTPEWLEATDFLTRLVLAEDMPEAALAFIQQLSKSGVDTHYCDWLAAQALIQQHRFEEAGELLKTVTSVVDTSGRRHNDEHLCELKQLVDGLINAKRGPND